MSGYTLEDIDMIRRKSGISYQEAVALLEYHNGNLLHALIDLEKNGKILKDQPKQKTSRKNGFFSILRSLYCIRARIRREDNVIINFSILFCIACLIFAPVFTIISSILALAMGYRFSFTMHDTDFDEADLESTFHHAAENVKSSLGDMAKSFSGTFTGSSNSSGSSSNASQAGSEKKVNTEKPEPAGSFYDRKPAHSAPSIHVPRRVDSQDGSVRFEEETNGYSSATIE